MNYLNSKEIVQKDIINDTNKDSTKNQCRNIGVVSGIYKIINKVNGKYYVGNSKNIYTSSNGTSWTLRTGVDIGTNLSVFANS